MKFAASLDEKKNDIDSFTVQFYGDSVLIGKQELPLGQICTDILNADDEALYELGKTVRVIQRFLEEKICSAKVEKDEALLRKLIGGLNTLRRQMQKLPLYEHLHLLPFDTDEEITEEKLAAFERFADRSSEEYQNLAAYLENCLLIPADIHFFQFMTVPLLDMEFEQLTKRNPESYALGTYQFWTNERLNSIIELLPTDEMYLRWMQPVSIEYVTTNDHKKKKYCVMERMEFHSSIAFLKAEFFKCLMLGRTPRRCHNCGKFFLLENGYDVKYCNRIAPGETTRTCSNVGAHKKALQKKTRSMVEEEYARTYDRLKKRKSNGKISTDEWNQQAAYIQEIKENVARGLLDEYAAVAQLKQI